MRFISCIIIRNTDLLLPASGNVYHGVIINEWREIFQEKTTPSSCSIVSRVVLFWKCALICKHFELSWKSGTVFVEVFFFFLSFFSVNKFIAPSLAPAAGAKSKINEAVAAARGFLYFPRCWINNAINNATGCDSTASAGGRFSFWCWLILEHAFFLVI